MCPVTSWPSTETPLVRPSKDIWNRFGVVMAEPTDERPFGDGERTHPRRKDLCPLFILIAIVNIAPWLGS